jgi:RNA polymerase sigma factor (sigma-70 family)
MTKAKLDRVVHHLHQLTAPRAAEGVADGQLLERFAATHEEAAFAALLRRHGPLVLSVCRRVLRQTPDAEDVFQATFLLLACKARSIRKQASVASWLHGVAYRLAVKAKVAAARRQAHERQATDLRETGPVFDLAWRELVAVLDEELQRLPDKYRSPLVLCYLEGQTQEEAARQLGWPLGTVRGRLARAREQLRARLTRRGMTLPAAALATALAASSATGAVPAILAVATLKAALSFSLGKTAASSASAGAVALAEGMMKTMFASKLKLAAVLLLAAAALVGVRAGALWYSPVAARPPAAASKEKEKPADGQPPAPEAKPGQEKEKRPAVDANGDPLPTGAVARLGSVHFWHGDWSTALVFSPDGKLLAASRATPAEEDRVHVWERSSGKEVYEVRGNVAAFSPDGKTLATVANGISLWDAATGKQIRRFGGLATSLAFSPNGKLLASGYYGNGLKGRVRLWDVETGKESREFAEDNYGLGSCVAFSPDGKFLATGYYEKPGGGNLGRVVLWETDTGKRAKTLEAGTATSIAGGGKAIRFGADGQSVAWLGEEGAIHRWETATGKDLGQIVNTERTPWGGESPYQHMDFTPDGKTLAAVTYGVVHLWDPEAGKLLRKLPQPTDNSYRVAFAPDGKSLAVGNYRRVFLWETATGQQQFQGHSNMVSAVAFAPGGKQVVSVGQDATLRLWDPVGAKELRKVDGATRLLAFSPDGKTMALVTSKNRIQLSDCATGKEMLEIEGTANLGAFSSDGKTLNGVSLLQGPDRGDKGDRHLHIDGIFHLWDATTGKEIRQFSLGKFCYGVALSPDGRTVAVIDEKASIHIWEVATGKESLAFQGVPFKAKGPGAPFSPEFGAFTGIAFSPDGRALAVWSYRPYPQPGQRPSPATVLLLDAATGTEQLKIEGAGGAVAFSSDDRTLIAVKDDYKTLGLWDLLTGKEIRAFEGHRSWVTSLAFSPDGKALASGSDDTTALVWDVAAVVRGDKGPKPAEAAPELAPKELESLWADLGGADVPKARQALMTLAASLAQTVPFLKERLQPVEAPAKERIARLLKDLDSEEFEVREKAQAELEKLGELALPALRQALEDKPSLEFRRRVESILQHVGPGTVPGLALVRLLRAVEVLERIRTAEAAEVLERLAKGAPESRLTQDAKASAERLKKYPPAP